MSSKNNDINNQPESPRANVMNAMTREPRIPNPTISDYFQPDVCEMKHKGCTDDVKIDNNVRILTMNIHGCRLENNCRMKDIKESIKKHQIDVALFTESNAK